MWSIHIDLDVRRARLFASRAWMAIIDFAADSKGESFLQMIRTSLLACSLLVPQRRPIARKTRGQPEKSAVFPG